MSFSRLVAGVILVLSVFVSSTVDADTKPLEKPREPIVLKAPPSRTVVVPDLPVRRDCEDIGSANCKKNPLPLPVDLESRRDALRKDLGRSTTAETDSAAPAIVVGPDQAVISGKVLRNGLWPVAGAEIFFKGEINGVLRTLPVNGTTEIKVISADDGSYTAVIGNENYEVPDYVIMAVFADDHFVYYHDNVHDRNEERAVPVPLAPGSQIEDLNAEPIGESEAIMFWGAVHDSTGQPIPGIAVVPYIDGKRFLPPRFWDTTTDGNGKFTVYLPPTGQTATLELVDTRDNFVSGMVEGESWVLQGVSHFHVGTLLLERKQP